MVVGAEVECLIGGGFLPGHTWMGVSMVGHDVVNISTAVGSYGTACVVG